MNNDNPFQLQNLQNDKPILTKKHIVIIIVAFFLFVVAWFIFSILQSGTLEITASNKVPNNTTLSVEISGDEEGNDPIKLELKSGETKKVSVKKGLVRVDASAGNIRSLDIVEIKGLSTTKVTVPQGEQRAIRKLGSNVRYCPGALPTVFYSFSCSGSGPIYKHNPVNSNVFDTRTTAFDDMTFASTTPLGKGALALLTAEEDSHINTLRYANFETGTLEEVPLSKEVATMVNDERPIIIASQDPEKPLFILEFDRHNKALLYDSVRDTSPVLLELPDNATLNDDFGTTSFTLYGDNIVAYAGETDPTDLDEGPPQSEKTKGYGNNVYEFNLDGKLTKTIDLPKGMQSIGISKISDDFYTMEQVTGLDFYHYDGKKLTKVFQFMDAHEPIIHNGKAYSVVGSAIYSFEPKANGQFSMHSVFSSPAVSAVKLYETPAGLAFTATTARQEERPMDAYLLLDSEQTKPPLEETVSLERLKDIIYGYDYDDNQIIFNLRNTGFGFSYEQIRKAMEDKLKELGMDIGGRQVKLYPLN